MTEKKVKISKGTVIRTAVLGLAIANNCLALAGKSPLPFDSEQVTAVVSGLFTAGSAIAAWWKNNSFTQPAIKADTYKNELKTLDKIRKGQ